MGVVTITPVMRAMLALVPATLAATAWWMWVDDISLVKAFASPFPYLMLACGLLLGLPVFFTLHAWLGDNVVKFLGLASLAIMPAVILALSYFLYPRSIFAAFLLISTVWVGTSVFWLQVRNLKP